ncbi:MAG: ABC transporter substrate-binding protein [Deltaproteobacteria bacterium]|nr:ABC transporter substrate-binding protein [Deltaproteobacteria bacterium]
MLLSARSWLMVVFIFSLSGPARAGEPLDLVRSAADKVIALLRDPQFKAADRKRERAEKLRAIINPIFDYDEIARRTLAPHWERRTPAEREEFTKLFRAFLEKIYADQIDIDDGERLVFSRETVNQDFAEVESKWINGKNEESPLIYRLKRTDGKWKVYDAVVVDISIVNNYRSQFNRVIGKSSFEELKKCCAKEPADLAGGNHRWAVLQGSLGMKLLEKLFGKKSPPTAPEAPVLRNDYEVILTDDPFNVEDRENVRAFVHLREMESYDEFKKMPSDPALRHGPLAVMSLNYLADQSVRKLLVLASSAS